jgi:hypothetical protein
MPEIVPSPEPVALEEPVAPPIAAESFEPASVEEAQPEIAESVPSSGEAQPEMVESNPTSDEAQSEEAQAAVPEPVQPVMTEVAPVAAVEPEEPAPVVEAPVSTPVQVVSVPEPPRAEIPSPETPKMAAEVPPAPVVSSREAQQALASGQLDTVVSYYDQVIRTGEKLEDTVHELRDALYRFPVEISLWQLLGDAYMRSNCLQEAIDAYTKAEELIR